MTWFKESKLDSLEEKIKDFLRSDPFCHKMRNKYNIPIASIDDSLEITVKKLDKNYSEADHCHIYIDESIAEDKDFFPKHLHFVVHEFIHWLNRQSEKRFYFNDLEEVESFSYAIAWELRRGASLAEVKEKIYPIIASHFEDKSLARRFFLRLVENAWCILKQSEIEE